MKNTARTTHLTRGLSLILAFCLIVAVLPSYCIKAEAATSTITIKAFGKLIKDVVGEDILTESEKKIGSNKVTNQRAAVLLNRADEKLNGTDYDEDLYKNVVNLSRISDIKKASNATFKKALRLCFVKGIMPGKSNGTYSQTRKMQPTTKITKSEATSMINRLKSKSKRIKLTWDGQVTRTKNLPSNYKQYPYILASFPNSFYEAKCAWKYYSPSLTKDVDYYTPAGMYKDKFGDYKFTTLRARYWKNWEKTVRTNLQCRLNYKYNCSTSTFNAWAKKLAATYQDGGVTEYKNEIMDDIKWYRKWANQCKTKIASSKIVIEPSTMYQCNGTYYVRCYIKFKVNAGTVPTADSGDQNGLIQGDAIYFPGLKNNKTYSAIVDIPLSGAHDGSSTGEQMRVDTSLLSRTTK